MASNSNAFEEALNKFKRRLTDAERRNFESIITLDDLKRDILKRNYFQYILRSIHSPLRSKCCAGRRTCAGRSSFDFS